MNASQQLLLDRLMAFEFDEPDVELRFAQRLARENGWILSFTERVIGEYKRFLFLAIEAGHVASPSEQVDQCWHMHLTYTRSYWNELCGKLLGQPLHHGPTKGGAAEQAKFIELYNQTLASYRRLFGEAPPADIWPSAEQRFGEDLHHVTVNTRRCWIIPKPRLPRWSFASQPAMFALGLVGLPLAAVPNPLDWRGPDFLAAYVPLAVIAAMAALIVRVVLAPRSETIETETLGPLDPYELACLAGRPGRAVQAAFAAMVQAKTLRIVTEETKTLGLVPRTTTTIQQGEPLQDDAPRLELALFNAAVVPARNLAPLTQAGLPVAQEMEKGLRERGLLASGPPAGHCVLASLIMALPLLLGVAKIAVGLSRGRPVDYLIVLCVLTAAAALAFLLIRPRLSVTGRAALESTRAKHASTTQLARSAAATLSPTELATSIGLLGVGMLAYGPLAEVHTLLRRPGAGGPSSSSSSSGCSGGGCGGGGCGGGGCGGGGCGGGGCGGCGGG